MERDVEKCENHFSTQNLQHLPWHSASTTLWIFHSKYYSYPPLLTIHPSITLCLDSVECEIPTDPWGHISPGLCGTKTVHCGQSCWVVRQACHKLDNSYLLYFHQHLLIMMKITYFIFHLSGYSIATHGSKWKCNMISKSFSSYFLSSSCLPFKEETRALKPFPLDQVNTTAHYLSRLSSHIYIF